MTAPPRSIHRNTFDFLRLVAATVVVVAHASVLLDGQKSPLAAPAALVDGVGMFFVISGFLVYKSAARTYEKTGGWREFARNRFLRVAPALYAYTVVVAVLLVAIGAVPVADMLSLDVAKWLTGTLLLVPLADPAVFASFGTGQLNPALWTITAEVSFYLVIPFLYLAARRWGMPAALLCLAPVAVFGPALTFEADGVLRHLLHDTFVNMSAYFVVGVFWTRYWDRAPKQFWVFIASLAAYLVVKEGSPDELYQRVGPAIVALPLSYCIIWFAYLGPKSLAGLTHRVGDLSYGTYLWHLPIINYFAWQGWRGAWTVPAVVVVSWSFAQVSWRVVEKPLLGRKRVSEREIETGEKVA